MGGSLFGQLDLGKRALNAQQTGMSVTGHNIANVDNENYSRQKVNLEAQHPAQTMLGAGVDVVGVKRVADKFIDKRLVVEQSKNGELTIRQAGLKRLEELFNDAEGRGLRNELNEFWNSWGQLANEPENELFRKELISKSQALATRMRNVHAEIQEVRREYNGRVSATVDKINQLAKQLVEQNQLIHRTAKGRGEANDLRDEREGTLKELSKLIDIRTTEQGNNVSVALSDGWPLVTGTKANRLEASFVHSETGLFSVRGVDTNGISSDLTRIIKSGELREFLMIRDETAVHFSNKLDELAAELSFKINQLHNPGTGINSTRDRLKSAFALRDDAVSKPLPFLQSGVFSVQLADPNGRLLDKYSVDIVAGEDTIGSIIAKINATVADPTKFSASLAPDGSVMLESKGPYNFIISGDQTNFSAVMGFNNFLESLNGAADIHVNPFLVENPNYVVTGNNLAPGDNTRAIDIHQLQFSPTMQANSITFDEFYSGTVAELGLLLNRTATEKENQDVVLDQYEKLRNEISSVNMDEEVADMVMYQRGFEAASKFISTIDEMTGTVINM